MTFEALVVEETGEAEVSASIQQLTEDRLPAGNVTVAVEYTTVNYKDGLCMQAKNGLVRELPTCAGNRLCGIRRNIGRLALQARRQSHPDGLASRRNALGRLLAEGSRQCRLARAVARWPDNKASDGHWNGWFRSNPRNRCLGRSRSQARSGRSAGHRRRRRSRFDRDLRFLATSDTRLQQ